MIRKFLNFFSKKKTKLGVNFILFDGEELLEHAIKPIRDQADFISVVYQTESYHGRTCSPELEATLFQLKSSGLIDEICHFKPNTIIPGQYNELKQRNIGLELSRKKNCTHHISMDCDEIYIEEEFKRAKEQMISGGYDATFCELKYYYKSSKYEMVELPESILVSLFIKINKNTKFNTKLEYPFFVEPTRRVELGKYKVYAKDEVLMHHLSYVRKNIRLKLENSANLGLYEAHLDSVVSYFEDWEYPEKGLLAAASFFYVEIQQSESNLPLIEFQ